MLYYSRKKIHPWLWWQRTILCIIIAIKSVSFFEWFFQLKPLSLQSHNSFLFFSFSYIITANRWNRYTELFQKRKGLGTDLSEWLCNFVVLVRWSSLPLALRKNQNSVDLSHHRILATVSKSPSLPLRVSTKTV